MQVTAKIDKAGTLAELKEDIIVSKCNQSHADIFRVIFINLFFSLTFSWTGWFRNYRFWDGLFFL